LARFSDANKESNPVSAIYPCSDYDMYLATATIAETPLELPIPPRPPLPTLSPQEQVVSESSPSFRRILTSLDSTFFHEEDSSEYPNLAESSSRYWAVQSSPPLLRQQNPPSICSSTIADITISSRVGLQNKCTTIPTTTRDFIPILFIYFHCSTLGIGLAKH